MFKTKVKTLSLVVFILLTGCQYTKSNGERIGTPTKIAKEGFLFKTYEVEMIKGGLNGGSGAMSHPFDFTIPSSNLNDLAVAQKALNNGSEIKVIYHQKNICPFSSETACNFSDSIQEVKHEQ